MTPILPDTSAWVELIRKTGRPAHLAFRRLLSEDAEFVVTEPVVFEVLSGARSDRELGITRRRLLRFPMLSVGGLATYERAATIQRACRAGGETIRTPIDCLVAAVAIQGGASVLHANRDFDAIARHTDLRIERV